MLFSVVCTVSAIVLLTIWLMTRDQLSHFPGPSLWELIWKYKVDPLKMHLLMSDLQRKYGPVFKVPRPGEHSRLILCGYESIYQVLVKEGKAYGGRPMYFRLKTILAGTGILGSVLPDDTWRTLRKTSQRHFRQFGDGMSRLEAIIVDIAEDMFVTFSSHCGEPYNPRNIVFDTALNSIAFLIIGKRTKAGEPIVEKMREYESLFRQTVSTTAPFGMKMLDVFPWLRHFGWKPWDLFKRTLQLESEIWQAATEFADSNPKAESICSIFREQFSASDNILTEQDAIKSTLSLLLAGVITTSGTFYATINILAHNPDVQNKVYEDIQKRQEETDHNLSLQDRPDLHYTRAVLFEVLRYVTITAAGVPHVNLQETTINGMKVPSNTIVTTMLWNLHHDEDFWETPFTFCPERFLDDAGKMVSADNPLRKHLMPFGAGTRVCLGESLALTRLFLWITTVVQRFRIRPAPGNEPHTCDPRNFEMAAVFNPTLFEVIFENRI